MNLNDQATIALVVSLFTGFVLPLIKNVFNKLSGDRKQVVDENVTFAKEWRELYQQMEAKVTKMETTMVAMETNNRTLLYERGLMENKNKTLEARVSELEAKFALLTKAFEYLVTNVSASHAEAVEKAKEIAKGNDSWQKP